MKRLITMVIMVLAVVVAMAQAPEKFTYQAVVRSANNALVTNTLVGVRVSILQGSATGSGVYVETQMPSTNANGLITLNIGDGNAVFGTFGSIDWSAGPYFLKTEIDPAGGNNYSVTSTQQLLSVPYALYAKEAGNSFSGDYNDLTNTPDIPTVPTNVSAFTNDAGYITMDSVPAIPTVPTNVSAFTNDAGYLTGYTETDPQFNAWDKDYNDLINKPVLFDGDYNSLTNQPTIPTVPTNVSAFTNDVGYLTEYTEQQVLSISNDTLFLTGGSFVKLPAGFDGDYNSLTNKPTIPTVPTNVSAFTNDAGYITGTDIPAIPTVPTNVSAFTNDAGYLTEYTEQQVLSISNDTLFLTGGSYVKLPAGFDGDYNSLTNKPVIPTTVGELTNDANYITIEQVPEQMNADWNATEGVAQILNKPTNVSAFTNDAGYLTGYTEQQVLSISNDTLFLTGGSYVKLPAGFDGDYNSLTNKPVIPTTVGELTNDANYITIEQVPAQVNADWNATEGAAQILNKPTIPTNVGAFTNDAGYLTEYIEQQVLSISNDTLFLTGGSFVKLPAGFDGDYNSLTNKPVIPMAVGELTNDANYITIEQVPAQVNADWNATEGAAQILNKPELFDGDYNSLTNKPTIPTNVGAFTNDAGYLTEYIEQQVLSISNDTLFLTGGSFVKLPAGFDGDYNSLTNKPVIPMAVGELTNDANYITIEQVPAQVNADWNATEGAAQILNKPELFDGDYNSLTNTPTIPTIPTNVGAFTNDAGYLTEYIEQQVLSISNDTLFLTGGSYVKLPAGFDGDYNSLTNKPVIPMAVGELTNDANYITIEEVPAQVNADWNATEGAAQILNKPELFDGDYNSLTNTPTIPTVPTNVSAFTNDAGYITAANVQEAANIPTNVSAFNNDAGYITSEDIPEIPTVPTNVSAFNNDAGYLTEYTEQQVLSISNDTLFLTGGSFVKLPAGFDGDYNSLTNKPVIPTTVGELTNNANYITMEDVPAQVNADWNATEGAAQILNKPELFDGDYNSLTNAPTIPTVPTNVSAFTNDAGYITAANVQEAANIPTNVSAFNNDAGYITSEDIPEIPTVPTNVSAFTNDAGYLTSYTESQTLADVTSQGNSAGNRQLKDVSDPTESYDAVNLRTLVSHINSLQDTFQQQMQQMQQQMSQMQQKIDSLQNIVNSLDTNDNTPSGTVVIDEKSCPAAPTVTDHEGNVYATVQIGEQCWMRDNLRTTTSPSTGTYLIPAAGTGGTYTGKQAFWYDNDSATYAPMNYGLRYNWNAAVDTFNTAYGETSVNSTDGNAVSVTFNGHRRGICPAGWHLPSDAEWTMMTNYVGGHSEYTCGGDNNNIAKALASTEGWNSYSGECYPGDQSVMANNATGFSAVPAGLYLGSSFTNAGISADFWSSTQYYSSTAYGRYLSFNRAGVSRNASGKNSGRSVRCLRDSISAGGDTPTPQDTTVVPSDTIVTPTDTTNTSYGIPCPNVPTVTDYDGNIYNTVKIGNQCWMKENLRTTHYSDGTEIPVGANWGHENGDVYRYIPDNDTAMIHFVGYSYTIRAALCDSSSSNNIPSGIQGICPTGWHVPSPGEWNQLLAYVQNIPENMCGTMDAKALADKGGWNVATEECTPGYNQNENNITGFSARSCNGIDVRFMSSYYSSSVMQVQEYIISSNSTGMWNAFSYAPSFVRCLRDSIPAGSDTTTTPQDTAVTPVDITTTNYGIPCPNTPTVIDHEGNVYATVQIGNQCWMRDNLRTTTSPTTGTYLISASGTGNTYTGKQARWYNNDSATYAPMNYGLLYNWNAAADTFNAAFGELSVNTSSSNAVSVTFNGHRRGICPAGWHLPSDAEWTAMTNYVKSQNEYLCDSNISYIAKALANSLLWNSSTNTCAVGNNPSSNNATGFSAVPAGRCNGSSFYDAGSSAYFWSSSRSVSYPDGAYDRALFDYRADVNRGRSNESSGFSVRCLRD